MRRVTCVDRGANSVDSRIVSDAGAAWGRFRITDLVGRGSFGRVLKLIDAQTGEPRALKLVPDSGAAMLLDEFDQLARLRHPSLPRVFEVQP